MHPILFNLPVWLAAALAGGVLGASLADNAKRKVWTILAGLGAAALAGAVAAHAYGGKALPVHSYGVMILLGFLCGVWLPARRARLIGAEPRHVMDVGVGGVVLGLLGARLFYVIMTWSQFNPFQPAGFDFSRVLDMFKLWQGGLVFFGAFLVVLPWAWLYSRWHKIRPLVFLDLLVPGLAAGLAFGRIGCFLNGCCYGSACNLPWAVTFPIDSPAYKAQALLGQLPAGAAHSLPVHPAQLYSSISAALIAGFLYALWPRRRFDGQVTSIMMIMVGLVRFFEEMLRNDDVAAFPNFAPTLTIAQWVAIGLIALGLGLLATFYKFQRRANKLANGK